MTKDSHALSRTGLTSVLSTSTAIRPSPLPDRSTTYAVMWAAPERCCVETGNLCSYQTRASRHVPCRVLKVTDPYQPTNCAPNNYYDTGDMRDIHAVGAAEMKRLFYHCYNGNAISSGMPGFSPAAISHHWNAKDECSRPKMDAPTVITVTAGDWAQDEFIVVGSYGFWHAYSPEVFYLHQ
jgi:hypothetical protein